jgi:transposase
MARQADVRSLCYSRKSGDDLASITFDELRNPFNRYGLLMSSRPVFITWLQKNGMLADSMSCDRCNQECKLTARSKAIDGYTWRCPHRHETSLRHLSIFAGSHLHLEDAFNFILTYAEGASLSQSAFVSSMNYGSTALDWAKIVRNMYVHYYNDVIKPHVMRGCVEIDESLFGRRIKNNRGNPRGQRVWVFGLVERQTNYLKLFPVERRDATTLTAIIRNNVEEGSTLYSDDWRAYSLLPSSGYTHRIVQHKKAFAVDYRDPITGETERVHTNRIEGAWKHAKSYFRSMNGTSLGNFEAHLCEIMFRNRERCNVVPRRYISSVGIIH